jgi:hypothetical protein
MPESGCSGPPRRQAEKGTLLMNHPNPGFPARRLVRRH